MPSSHAPIDPEEIGRDQPHADEKRDLDSAPRWLHDGWAVRPETLRGVLTFPIDLALSCPGSRFVWRGAASSSWRVVSSLQRWTSANSSDAAGRQSVDEAEDALLARAREWGLGMHGATHLSDLHLLALMQHHGAPTRLLDVTLDPLTALWFASDEARTAAGSVEAEDGVLFAFRATDAYETMPKPDGSAVQLDNGLRTSLVAAMRHASDSERPVLVGPSVADQRMAAQQGMFLVGPQPHPDESDQPDGLDAFRLRAAPAGPSALSRLDGTPLEPEPSFVAMIVPRELKKPLRDYLDHLGRNEQRLYPDLAGFAAAAREHRLPLAPPRDDLPHGSWRDAFPVSTEDFTKIITS